MDSALSSINADILQPGQLIMLVPETGARQGTAPADGYSSRVEDLVGDAVVVSMPTLRRDLVDFPTGTPIWAYFQREGARYHFRAAVGGHTLTPFPVLYLTNVRELTKNQRRSHARIDVLLQPLQLLLRDEEQGDRSLGTRGALIVNMSGGGIGIVIREALSVGQILRVVVALPAGFGRMDVHAEVVRCNPVGSDDLRKWRIGLAFRGLTPEQQDRIVGFVIHQQVRLRRRGLL